jgi:putative tricarboxylic transport membrane protein
MSKIRKLRAGEMTFAWLLLAFSLFVLFNAIAISGFSAISSPGMFPMMAATVMVLSMVAVLINNRKLEKPDTDSAHAEFKQVLRKVFPKVFLIYAVIVVAYMVLFEPAGFVPSSAAFLFASIFFLRGGGLIKALSISAGSLAVIYVIFHTVFRVVLP